MDKDVPLIKEEPIKVIIKEEPVEYVPLIKEELIHDVPLIKKELIEETIAEDPIGGVLLIAKKEPIAETIKREKIGDLPLIKEELIEKTNTSAQNEATQAKSERVTMPPIPQKIHRNKPIVTKTRSEIWGHFTKNGNVENPRAACNYCGQSYACHSSKCGTSNMWSHLELKCKKYPHRIELQKRQKTVAVVVDKRQKTLKDMWTR